MQNSNAIVKKIYCIVINGKVEANMPFSSPVQGRNKAHRRYITSAAMCKNLKFIQ